MKATINQALMAEHRFPVDISATCSEIAHDVFPHEPKLAKSMVTYQQLLVDALRRGTSAFQAQFTELAADQREDWIIGRSTKMALHMQFMRGSVPKPMHVVEDK